LQLPSLKDKVAIVTGSSRGIGKAIALQLAKSGANVVVTARTEQSSGEIPGSIHETCSEIHSFGGSALPVVCNVRREQDIQQLIAKVLTTYDSIDILVNNAGIGNYQTFTETSLKHWELMFDINVMAPIILTQNVLPTMIKQMSGSIINISSHAATNIFSSTLSADTSDEVKIIGQSYGASKAAIERLSWGLAAELGEYNIAVNVLKPLKPVLTEGFIAQRPDGDYSSWSTPDAMAQAANILAAQEKPDGFSGTIYTAEELLALHKNLL
tara:strand:- start:26951 stop:27757 length:807 start_codon:yes stop_codon:yes gene_type:complete